MALVVSANAHARYLGDPFLDDPHQLGVVGEVLVVHKSYEAVVVVRQRPLGGLLHGGRAPLNTLRVESIREFLPQPVPALDG